MALDKPNKDSTSPFRAMPDQSTDYRIVVLGSAGVGKTNCVLRFVNGQFRENYIPTVEDTYRQVVSCNKQITTLQITDTTGSHSFPAMQRLSIQKGHAFILVYSITSKQTFEDLQPIYHQIREIKSDQQNETPILLMGCKSDEAACREVTENLGKQLANHWSCTWIETSAKNNSNIREAFQELLKLDKKRQFNFNVDSDGHLIEDNCATPMPSSPSPRGGKRSLVTDLSITESNSNGLNSTRPTTPVSQGNKTSRNSIMSTSSSSTSNAKKSSRTTVDQSEFSLNKNSKSKKNSTSDATSSANRKCLLM